MTMINVFFRLKNDNITVDEITEALEGASVRYSEVRKIPEFNGEVGAKGYPAVVIYLHISEVADVVEMMEEGIGAEMLVAW